MNTNAPRTLLLVSLLVTGASWGTPPEKLKQLGNDYFIVTPGGDYKIVVASPGKPTSAQVAELIGSGAGGIASELACKFSFGKFGQVPPDRRAIEGVLSKGSFFTDIESPEGYTYRLLVHPSVASGIEVYVPKEMAAAVEKLAVGSSKTLFTDYSVVFLVEKRTSSCSTRTIATGFFPIGRKVEPNVLVADLTEKGKYYLDLGLQIYSAISKLKTQSTAK